MMMMMTIRRADIYLSNGREGGPVERDWIRGKVAVIALVVVIMLVIVIINFPIVRPAWLGIAAEGLRMR